MPYRENSKMRIATRIAAEIGGGAGKFIEKTVTVKDGNYTVYVAVVYGDGNYERFSTLGKTVSSQHVRILIRGEQYTHMETEADIIRKTMTEKGYIPLSGIIGLEDIVLEDGSNKKQIALDYKVLS